MRRSSALGRAVAIALAAPGIALAQLVEGWAISGSNTLRAERYGAGGDRTFIPYQAFLGNTGYDEFTVTGVSRPSAYSLRRFLVSGVANDSPYRSQDDGLVPERLNFLAESGESALAWRAEAGDFFAFTTLRTQQRSLKGASVELQPGFAELRQSIVLFAGAAQPSWRHAQWSDDNTLGASWLVDAERFGRWNANLLRNERGPNAALSQADERSQTVASLAGEALFDLGTWKLRVEGEAAGMRGDHDASGPGITGRDTSDTGYFAQATAFDDRWSGRLRAERYGIDYRPYGAITPPDRRSVEAHLSWLTPHGMTLRARAQEFRDFHESGNALETRVAGAALSGSWTPWALSGMLDAFVQEQEREDATQDTRLAQVSLNLSRPFGRWIAQLNALWLDLDDRRLEANSTRTSQVQALATFPVAWGAVNGSITPGVLYRSLTGANATRDWQPTLSMALFGGAHRFTASVNGLWQDPRAAASPEVETVNASLDYRYRWRNHEFGVDAVLFDRSASPGTKSDAYRVGAFWTWYFESAPAVPTGKVAALPAVERTPAPDRVARNVSLLGRLAPGQDLAAVQRAMSASGFGGGLTEPRALVYEARLVEDVEQRQRVAIAHDGGRVERVALLLSLDGGADGARTYERVRRALLDTFGSPVFNVEEGAWGPNLAADLASGRFLRVTEWALPTGVLRLGVPRRIDGSLRIEVQHARSSSPPRDPSWGVETK
jgi:hypothetical protein